MKRHTAFVALLVTAMFSLIPELAMANPDLQISNSDKQAIVGLSRDVFLIITNVGMYLGIALAIAAKIFKFSMDWGLVIAGLSMMGDVIIKLGQKVGGMETINSAMFGAYDLASVGSIITPYIV